MLFAEEFHFKLQTGLDTVCTYLKVNRENNYAFLGTEIGEVARDFCSIDPCLVRNKCHFSPNSTYSEGGFCGRNWKNKVILSLPPPCILMTC